MRKKRRRKYLVSKSLQLRYMAMIIIIVLVISTGGGWIIYSSAWSMFLQEMKDVPTIDVIFIKLSKVILGRIILLVMASVCLAAAITMFVVHRIVGPLVRVRRIMEQLQMGIIPERVTFRRKDELKEVAEAIALAMEKLRKVTENNRKATDEALLTLGKLEHLIPPGGSDMQPVSEHVLALRETLKRIECFREEER